MSTRCAALLALLLVSSTTGCVRQQQVDRLEESLRAAREREEARDERLELLVTRVEALASAVEMLMARQELSDASLRPETGAGDSQLPPTPGTDPDPGEEAVELSARGTDSALADRLDLDALPVPDIRPGALPGSSPELAEARALFERSAWESAARAFLAFSQAEPQHPLVPDALYWTAECYLRVGEQRLALAQFEQVMSRYPEHDRASDSLLWMVHTHRALGENGAARAALRALLSDYPGSRAAREARATGMVGDDRTSG